MNRLAGPGPLLLLACAGAILMLALGIRQSFGLFLLPMTFDLGLGRGSFALAIALQNLFWGVFQPFAGMVADRFGGGRVLAASGMFYLLGLVAMALAQSASGLYLSAGLLLGLALSGCTFGVVMAVVGRGVETRHRSIALGIVGAAGSFGQFAMIPVGQALITGYGWSSALLLLAVACGLIVPLAYPLRNRVRPAGAPEAAGPFSIRAAVAEAGRRKGFWLLTFSFAVCGFQTIFIMVHLPSYLVDMGLGAGVGVMALALVGFCNTVGSYLCGYLGGRYSKSRLLSAIFLSRAAAIAAFLLLPVSVASTLVFAAIIGLTWLGTVPLTSALVAQIFGVRYLATLFGIAFLGHQVGSFAGAWFGGFMLDSVGSYQRVWLVAIGLSLVAAALCWPIDERPIAATPLAGSAA